MTRTQFQQVFASNAIALTNAAYGHESDPDRAVARVATWIRHNCRCPRPATSGEPPGFASGTADSLDHMMQIIGPSIQPGDLDHALSVLLPTDEPATDDTPV